MNQAEKFVTPCSLPTPYERELLIILIEECSEVIQRACKSTRFGVDEVQPGQDMSNTSRMSYELGDLQATMELAKEAGLIDVNTLSDAVLAKRTKLYKYMQTTN